MAGLVLAVFVPSVLSVAVTVREPAVLKVTLKERDEEDAKDVGEGRDALVSEEVSVTLSPVAIGFQLASTELTVTVKAVPAAWAVGKPVLPIVLPGTAVSPGARHCRFENAPAFTVRNGVV